MVGEKEVVNLTEIEELNRILAWKPKLQVGDKKIIHFLLKLSSSKIRMQLQINYITYMLVSLYMYKL